VYKERTGLWKHKKTCIQLKPSIEPNESVAEPSNKTTMSMPNICFKFCCEKCNYNTIKQYNYDKHLATVKHKKTVFCEQNNAISSIKSSKQYICKKCSKQYASHNGIWLHKKKCVVDNCNEPNTNIESNQDILKKDNMIDYLIIENKVFKNLIMELINKDAINNTNKM
jgi:hypothetical protein